MSLSEFNRNSISIFIPQELYYYIYFYCRNKLQDLISSDILAFLLNRLYLNLLSVELEYSLLYSTVK